MAAISITAFVRPDSATMAQQGRENEQDCKNDSFSWSLRSFYIISLLYILLPATKTKEQEIIIIEHWGTVTTANGGVIPNIHTVFSFLRKLGLYPNQAQLKMNEDG